MDNCIGLDFGSTSLLAGIYRSGYFRLLSETHSKQLADDSKISGANTGKFSVGFPGLMGLKQLLGSGRKATQYSTTLMDEGLNDLIRLNGKCRDFLNTREVNAVISVPCHYLDRERSALINLAEQAGFNRIRLIEESICSVMGSADVANSARILVYSLGAGLFSCSILEKEGKQIRVLNSCHSKNLSGDFLNSVILEKMSDGWSLSLNSLEKSHIYALFDTAIRAKQELSDQDKTFLAPPPGLVVTDSTGIGKSPDGFWLSRKEFEAGSVSFVHETLKVCLSALDGANLTVDKIDQVLLVGGSTRVPLIRQLVGESFECSVDYADHLAMTRGAAILALNLPESKNKPVKSQPARQPDGPHAGSGEDSPRQASKSTDWMELFKSDFTDSRQLWQEHDFTSAISKMEGLQMNLGRFIAELCLSAGRRNADNGKIDDAVALFTRGLELDQRNSDLNKALREAYDSLIGDAIRRSDHRGAMNWLQKGLAFDGTSKDWKKTQAGLRRNPLPGISDSRQRK